VVGETGGVVGGGRPGQQRRQGAPVQVRPPAGRQRLLDRQPGQLVPERHPAGQLLEHPRLHALVEVAGRGTGRLGQQPGRHRRGDDRGGIQHLPCWRGQPGRPRQHRVEDGDRDLLAAGGQDLGDEERVPAGRLVQPIVVDPAGADQGGHRLAGQRLQPEAAHEPGAGEIAEGDAQGMGRADLVVAERGHDQDRTRPIRRARNRSRSKVAWAASKALQQGGEQQLPRRLLAQQLLEPAADGGRDVGQRPQRPGGAQRVAGAPQDPGGVALAGAELPGQARLADPGLTTEEDQAPRCLPAPPRASRRGRRGRTPARGAPCRRS